MPADDALIAALEHDVHVGSSTGDEEIEITPELVNWYVEAIESDHPWYHGDSPFGGPIAPALILPSAPYRSANLWYLPNRYGNLHAKMQWELFRPIAIGEVISRSGVVVDRYVKRDRDFVVAESELRDAHGQLVARTRATQSFLVDQDRTGIVVERGREKQTDRAFRPPEGAAEGQREIQGSLHVVTPDQCNRFSGGRPNYHNDAKEAEKLGFREVVVQGTLSICFLSDLMTESYGAGWWLGGRMQVNLVNVLWAGETVRAKGIVRERTREGGVWREHLDIWTEKDDGTRTIAGTASAVLP
jgi:acyl dehydratase